MPRPTTFRELCALAAAQARWSCSRCDPIDCPCFIARLRVDGGAEDETRIRFAVLTIRITSNFPRRYQTLHSPTCAYRLRD